MRYASGTTSSSARSPSSARWLPPDSACAARPPPSGSAPDGAALPVLALGLDSPLRQPLHREPKPRDDCARLCPRPPRIGRALRHPDHRGRQRHVPALVRPGGRRIRPDVTLANLSLMNTEWHLRQLRRRETPDFDPAKSIDLWKPRSDTTGFLLGVPGPSGWPKPTAPVFAQSLAELDSLPEYSRVPKGSSIKFGECGDHFGQRDPGPERPGRDLSDPSESRQAPDLLRLERRGISRSKPWASRRIWCHRDWCGSSTRSR